MNYRSNLMGYCMQMNRKWFIAIFIFMLKGNIKVHNTIYIIRY